jgi:mannose-6-phosphate isomerase-like protein (cupin superfamily)
VVLGPALVRLRDGADTRDVTVPDGAAMRFVIPPGVAHAFQGSGPGPMLVVSFSTEPHDPAASDVVREVLIPPPD